MKYIVILLISIVLLSCTKRETSTTAEKESKKLLPLREDSVRLAGQRILNGESIWGKNEEVIFALMDSLSSPSPDSRNFYFSVFQKISEQADGYVGEAIGGYVLKFVSQYPDEFIANANDGELKSFGYDAGAEIAMSASGDPELDFQELKGQVSAKRQTMSDPDKQKLDQFLLWVKAGIDSQMEDK